MPLTKFETKRKRDAFGPIRGYVYQVELTIERWLDLQTDSVPELERGEDVETIHQAMLTQGGEQARLLEQIKARNRKVTFRSAAALGALASFYEHEHANPELNPNYRYVTNAQIAVERRSPVPDGTSLIRLWNQLREQPLTQRNQWAQLKLVRDFLACAPKPQDLSPKTWNVFLAFVKKSNHKAFHSFVRKVEWLANQTPTDLAAGHIQETLATKYKTAPDQVRTVYAILFCTLSNCLASLVSNV